MGRDGSIFQRLDLVFMGSLTLLLTILLYWPLNKANNNNKSEIERVKGAARMIYTLNFKENKKKMKKMLLLSWPTHRNERKWYLFKYIRFLQLLQQYKHNSVHVLHKHIYIGFIRAKCKMPAMIFVVIFQLIFFSYFASRKIFNNVSFVLFVLISKYFVCIKIPLNWYSFRVWATATHA